MRVDLDERTWARILHLSGWFTALTLGLGFIAPLTIWLKKRHESAFIDAHGAEALNFQISMIINTILFFGLGLYGVFLLGGASAIQQQLDQILTALGLTMVLCFSMSLLLTPIFILFIEGMLSTRAARAANRGHNYRYPWTFHFISPRI